MSETTTIVAKPAPFTPHSEAPFGPNCIMPDFTILQKKTEEREARIAAIINAHSDENKPFARVGAAIEVDSTAPLTTNRKQLAEIAVIIPKKLKINNLSDIDCTYRLWQIIYGLAHLGIYFSGTDNLSDRGMLELLQSRILDEKVNDIVPSPDMSEFIDLSTCPMSDCPVVRDAYLPRPVRLDPAIKADPSAN